MSLRIRRIIDRLALIGIATVLCCAETVLSQISSTTTMVDGIQTQEAGASGHEALSVRFERRNVQFRVKTPDATISEAWLDEPALVDLRAPTLAPVPGYLLTNRVIVRLDDPTRLAELLAENPLLVAKPTVPERGFWTLAVGSVAEAAALAERLTGRTGIELVEMDLQAPRSLRTVPTDPYFDQQWHLKNELDPLFDVNAEAAWDLGYTGAGVIVGIVEDKWDYNHIDLAANFSAEATQDLPGSLTSHATACAGIVAAVANNGIMGVGVAYGAQISGLRYGTDSEDAAALLYRNDLNDIKSNSWGPLDDAQIDPLPAVVRAALEEGVAAGRQGRGEIFVWAAGNGGASNDRVDYDGYASSRYTIAVGAIGDLDQRASYSERGASLMLVSQSDGNNRGIATTTRYNGWTRFFGGTSAAAPLVAGTIALMLEANPSLTWRDVQHVLIESARKCQPSHSSWIVNGGGYLVSDDFGHGAADAGAAVALAENWHNVAHEVVMSIDVSVDQAIPDADPAGISFPVEVPGNLRIESVELIPHVLTENIGDLEIVLTAPSGMQSLLARNRFGDGRDNYIDYVFTSLRHWGELSAGVWSVRIADHYEGYPAHWVGYRLNIYGTPACPGDLNEDGVVDLFDLLVLLTAYAAEDTDPAFNPAADFDNSRVIDLSDLAEFLGRYGTICE